MAKSLASNIIAKGTLNLFNVLLPFIITPYVYRVLGAANMGNIDYATTLYGYFGMLGLSGIYNYGLREISAHRNNKEKVNSIYKNLFCIGIFTNLIVLLGYICFILLFIKDPALRIISWILCGNLLSQMIYVEWYNEAMEEFRFITIKTVVIRLVSFIFIFCFIKGKQDEYVYVIITVAVAIANYLVSYIYSRRKIKLSFRQLFSGINVKPFFIPLLTILILNNTGYLYTVIDRTLLGHYTGTENVAFFYLGQKIVELCKTLVLSVVFATLPRLSLYLNEDKSLYQSSLVKIMRLTLSLIIPVGIGLFILSPEIILLFGGQEYIPAIPSMRIFALRIILLAVDAILYNQIIFLHGKEKLLVIYNLICGGINIALNFAFLSILDPFVSISCTLASEILFVSLCIIYIRKRLFITTGLFKRHNLVYLFAALAFFPIIWVFRQLDVTYWQLLILSIISCCAYYLILMYAIKDKVALELVSFVTKLFKK